ncbi:MAG: DUF2779 domain-containing protein [Lachnospiraceae bacterium]|nr:DUF2779 domain-containing protein [Lachnospiraceae bacterium]
MNLSKSKYTRAVQCNKMLWMDAHKPEEADTSCINESVLENGNVVGDLAMSYFGDFVEVPYEVDKSIMLQKTQELLAAGVENICEASFAYDGNFCSVDILRVSSDGVEIVEVKSSTKLHDIYVDDMAYQMYVLTGCGLNVKKVYNMHINNKYVRHGELELKKLFVLEDCTELCRAKQEEVQAKIAEIKDYMNSTEEPARDICMNCMQPYECVYFKYCSKHIQSPSVFDISGMTDKRKFELYKQGVVTFQDVIKKNVTITEKQKCQVETEYYNLPAKVDKAEIKNFVDSLTYPLYFLDFETFQQAIPEYDGVSPYNQIPFQYSLHVMSKEEGELEHYEFLAKEGTDPRRALAEQLVRDIPMDVCTLAYNMGFEKGVIAKLAALYPDLSDHLMNIHKNIKDLMTPFSCQAYYCKEFAGSYSIKYVLPALCSGDPELDYHSLEGVHNGMEAMNAFADLPNHSQEEIAIIRKNLLAYCRLDTLAMVKVLEVLKAML